MSGEEFKICRKRLHRKRHLTEESEDEISEQKRLLANSQERVRMQRINVALENLKQALPEEYQPCRRRMSKIRTLRSAMDYIRGLSEMLDKDNERRRMMYMQAREYVAAVQKECHAAYGSDISLYQTPTPYFPYLGPLCEDYSGPTFQIDEQTPEKQMTAVHRQLDFNAPTKRLPPHRDDEITPEIITAGRSDCLRDARRREVTMTRRISSATITSGALLSPFTGTRNDHELNASFVTTKDIDARPIEARSTCARARTEGCFDVVPKTIVDLCED